MAKYALLVAVAGLLLGADDPKAEAVKKEMKKIAGEYRATDYVADGKRGTKAEELATLRLRVYGGGNFKLEREGQIVVDGTLRIDPTKTPKMVNIEYTTGPDEGKTALGIYELTDDTLRICRAIPEEDRPTEFASKAGSRHVLLVYKRLKR
jgi:uncharacterized protein (TIGR03067 family)